MDQSWTSEHNRHISHLSRFVLLLSFAGLQSVLSSDGNQLEQLDDASALNVTIVAPDYVTVGVPSSAGCDAQCPACTYSMSLDGQAAQGQGNDLAFTVTTWVESLTVTCIATTANLRHTGTATKTLQVLAGPTNISISGPDVMNPNVSHTYSCHALCRPSCSYSWKRDHGPWVRGQDNVVSVTPREMRSSTLLICKATNSVSGLFVATTRNIAVTSGPSKVQIKGPNVIEVAEKYMYVCSSECHPSCRYTSSLDGQTVRGREVEVTVDRLLKSITLKCEAQNTATRRTGMALRTIQVKGFNQNVCVRPEVTSALFMMTLMISFTL